MTQQPNSNSPRKKPDYLAFAVRPAGDGPRYTRIGAAFNLKNGGLSVLYDAVPLSGQIVLVETDADKPSAVSYGYPARRPDFEANMVRESGGNSYWTEVGSAYRQEGYVSILLDVVPQGKLILTPPKEEA